MEKKSSEQKETAQEGQQPREKIVRLSTWKKYRGWQDQLHPAARFFTPFGVAPIRGLAEAPIEHLVWIRDLWRLASRRPGRASEFETFSQVRERLGIDDDALRREIRMSRVAYGISYIFFAMSMFFFCSTLVEIFTGAAAIRPTLLVLSDLFWRGVWVVFASIPLFHFAFVRWQEEQQVFSFRGFMRQPNLLRRIWFGF